MARGLGWSTESAVVAPAGCLSPRDDGTLVLRNLQALSWGEAAERAQLRLPVEVFT